jgi:hypothetical protein
MAHLPEEIRKAIGAGIRKAYESPAARKRLRDSWTPTRRAKSGRNRRDYFAALRADPVRYAEHKAKISAGRRSAQECKQEAGDAAQGS